MTDTSSGSAVTQTTTAAAAASSVQNGLATLSSNYQEFLTLLTTQLKNQDPTSPMDTNQFTQQLVQMSGVEQQLLGNNLLTTLVAQGQQGGLADGVSYIGKSIQANTSTETLANNSATWTYTLPTQAASATVTITDSNGNTVYTGASSGLSSGSNTFTWNGRNASGVQLANGGTYTLAITAKDGAGNTLNAQTLTTGTVTGASITNGVAYVTVGGVSVPVSSVVSVKTPGS
jgi:flagellar basal-body rod modification protein FlgD